MQIGGKLSTCGRHRGRWSRDDVRMWMDGSPFIIWHTQIEFRKWHLLREHFSYLPVWGEFHLRIISTFYELNKYEDDGDVVVGGLRYFPEEITFTCKYYRTNLVISLLEGICKYRKDFRDQIMSPFNYWHSNRLKNVIFAIIMTKLYSLQLSLNNIHILPSPCLHVGEDNAIGSRTCRIYYYSAAVTRIVMSSSTSLTINKIC